MVKPQIEAALPRVGLSGKEALVEKGVRIHDVPAVAGIGIGTVQGPEQRMDAPSRVWLAP